MGIFDSEAVASLRRRDAVMRRGLALADALAAVAALLTVSALVAPDWTPLALVVVVPLVITLHKITGLYDRDDMVLRRSTLDELPALLQVASAYTLIAAVVVQASSAWTLTPIELAGLWLLSFALTTVGRTVARASVRTLLPPERCIVMGDELLIDKVSKKIVQSRGRATVVATLPWTASAPAGTAASSRIELLIQQHKIQRVVIVPATSDAADTLDLIRIAKAAGVRVSILPRMLEAVGTAVEFEQVDGMTMLGVRRFGLTRSSRAIKRTFDLLIAGVGLIAAAPILAVIAAAIRLESHGPVLFRQTRIGRGGKAFEIWKFRSMVVDADERKDDLMHLNEAGDGMFKLADDPRITRVGRFLRRSSLDELPQLFNVLSGQMSVVGPRPLVVAEDRRIVGVHRSRLHLTPGMTGPWQVLGSTRVPLDEMVGIDYLYVANWTLWADVKIMLRTIPHVFGSRGI